MESRPHNCKQNWPIFTTILITFSSFRQSFYFCLPFFYKFYRTFNHYWALLLLLDQFLTIWYFFSVLAGARGLAPDNPDPGGADPGGVVPRPGSGPKNLAGVKPRAGSGPKVFVGSNPARGRGQKVLAGFGPGRGRGQTPAEVSRSHTPTRVKACYRPIELRI